MVARVGMISARFDDSMMDEESRYNLSAIQFANSTEIRVRTTMPEEQRDISNDKVEPNLFV